MAQNRAQQKRLEKHKKKRELARKNRTSLALPSTPGALVREAAKRPFGPAFIATDWRDADESAPGLVTVVVTRRMAGGALVPAVALVDRTCLGVKNGYVMQPMGEHELDVVIARMSEAQEMEPCELLVAQSVVYSALDYARSLGFSPHRDFPATLFGPRPATLLDTPHARPARPTYVSGPDDDVRTIVAQLAAAVGVGNFDYLVLAPDAFALDGDGELDDEDELQLAGGKGDDEGI